MKKNLHIIYRIALVQCVILVFSIVSFASTVEGTEKKGVEKKSEKTEKIDPKKDKPDSLNLGNNNISLKNQISTTSYKPEKSIEQDSLDQSGSVGSFNFIQYIIENFKFAEEMF